MTEIIGLVLAGGKSRRMGQNKADLVLDNMRLLDRAKNLLQKAGCDRVIVSGPDDLPDRFSGKGPLAGLDAVVADLSDLRKILVIPVDMPHLEIGLLQDLIAQSKGKVGVHFKDQPLPFCVSVSQELRTHLQAVLTRSDKDRSLFHLFRALEFQALPIIQNQKRQFENCNTPEQFAAMGGRL